MFFQPKVIKQASAESLQPESRGNQGILNTSNFVSYTTSPMFAMYKRVCGEMLDYVRMTTLHVVAKNF